MAKRNYSRAVEHWQLAVREKPNNSKQHRMLGQALLMDGKPEDALREFRLSVALDPDSDVAHHFLGTALFEGQQLQAAEKEFREAVRLNATPDNHYSLAACLMSLDRYEEALSELEIASRLDPEKSLYRARREELQKLIRGTTSSR
jgi:Flp pilus assembly protein TadD